MRCGVDCSVIDATGKRFDDLVWIDATRGTGRQLVRDQDERYIDEGDCYASRIVRIAFPVRLVAEEKR